MKKCSLGFWSASLALILPSLPLAAQSPIVVFGLTNAPLGQAVLVDNVVTNLSTNGVNGVSVFLGEADSGVFAYPDTDDRPQSGDYMLGKVYGKLNGTPDQLICAVRGRTIRGGNGFGVYPVSLDFSPLGVTNFFAQVFSWSGRLVAQGEIGTGEPIMRTDFNGYHVSRVNPFWRMADGSIAAVIEFGGSTGFQLPGMSDEGPFPFGTRLVLRALNPTGSVDFVSRVDITTGYDGPGPGSGEEGSSEPSDATDGISMFRMNEMRLGMFGRPHKALGDVLLQARGGALKIARLDPEQPEPENDFMEGAGVHIELNRARKSIVEFQPVDLSASNAQFGVSVLAASVIASGRFAQTTNGLTLSGIFEPIGSNPQTVRLEVYKSGQRTGATPDLELPDSVFPLVTISDNPHLLRAVAQANTLEAPPSLGFRFDTAATFTVASGGDVYSFEGDEAKFLSVGTNYNQSLVQIWVESLSSVVVNSRGLSDFTIVAEQEEPVPAPALSITRTDDHVTLTWPDPNRAFYVLVSSNLESGANELPLQGDYTQPIATATDTIRPGEVRFYWLIHSGSQE